MSTPTYRYHNDDGTATVEWAPSHPKWNAVMKKRCTWTRFDLSDMDFLTFMCTLAKEADGVERSPAPSIRRPRSQIIQRSFEPALATFTITWERDRKRPYWSAGTTSDANAWKNQHIRWPYPGERNYEPPSP